MASAPWTDQPPLSAFALNDKLLGIDDSDGISKTILGSVLLAGLSAPKLLHVRNEQDLIDQFGADIIIPAGEAWSLAIDDSFTLSKPFKIGNASALEIIGTTINLNITYSGADHIFKLENVLNPAQTLVLRHIDFTGNDTNDIFNLKLSLIVILEDVIFNNFFEVGSIETQFFDIRFVAFQVIQDGLIIINPTAGNFNQVNLNQPASAFDVTAITILSPDNVVQITANQCFSSDDNSTMFYLDPLASVGSAYIIENTTGTFTDLFRQGLNIPVTSVFNFAGVANFVTTLPHGLSLGDPVAMSTFSESTYNGTFIVGFIPNATEFLLINILFVANDTGIVDSASLDSTDILVTSRDNPGFPTSMSTGNAGLQLVAPITVTINTQDVPEVITDVNWVQNNLERFSEDTGTPNQGRLILNGLSTKRYSVTYSATINRSGGGGVDVGIVLLKNGTIIGVNPPRAFNSVITGLTRTDIVELTENDVIQVAVINYNGIADIDVYQVNLAVSLTN